LKRKSGGGKRVRTLSGPFRNTRAPLTEGFLCKGGHGTLREKKQAKPCLRRYAKLDPLSGETGPIKIRLTQEDILGCRTGRKTWERGGPVRWESGEWSGEYELKDEAEKKVRTTLGGKVRPRK